MEFFGVVGSAQEDSELHAGGASLAD